MTAAVLERSRPHVAGQRTNAHRRSSASARAATARVDAPRPAGRAAARRPKLKVLDQRAARQRAWRRNALMLLFVVVLVGFFGVAFVHAELVAGQQDLDAARTEIAEAEARKANLSRAAEEASSPKAIVARAEQLGMVRAYQPVYLEASAPLRDMPAIVAPPSPVASSRVQLASSVPGVSAGISSEVAVVVPVADPRSVTVAMAEGAAGTGTPVVATTAPADEVGVGAAAADDGSAQSEVAVAATATGTSTLGGAAVVSSAGRPTPVSGATGQTSVSIAGSRAVTTGSVGTGDGSG